MARPQFEVVEDTPEQPPAERAQAAALSAIMLALKALSQRAIVALANLFTLLTVGSVFWLWLTIPNPNVLQLVELGMYAAFVLAANWIVRRK